MILIRKLQQGDIEQIGAIEVASPEVSRWGVSTYNSFLLDPRKGTVLVAEQDGAVAGFVCIRSAAQEAEVMSLAVHPSRRGQGIGSRLLEEGLRLAEAAGARRAFLEVRPTNRVAVRLYERLGFQPLSTRKAYYRNPTEDAWVLARSLPLDAFTVCPEAP